MKTMLFVLILCVSAQAQFIDNQQQLAQQLYDKLVEKVADYQDTLRKFNIRSDSICSTDIMYAIPGKYNEWPMELKGGEHVFFVQTMLASVQVEIWQNNTLLYLTKVSGYSAIKVRFSKSGEYRYIVKSTENIGLYKTNIIYILKNGEKYEWE